MEAVAFGLKATAPRRRDGDGAAPQGQCSGSAKPSHREPSSSRDPRRNVTHGWPTSATTLSGRHHRWRASWHDDDRPVRVGDIGHVNGMDVHHDQEQRDHGQRADQQRGDEPGVDFDRPIHNGITTYRPRSWAARPG